MKSLALLLPLLLSASGILSAADLKPITSPDLKSPLENEWSVRHGQWNVKDGVMTVAELPENKHAAVLWHSLPLQAGAVECQFQFNGAKVFILGCDGDRHIGRVVISPKLVRLMDDSTEVKGKSPATELAKAEVDLKPGEWIQLRYEWDGEKMSAEVQGARLEANHPNLGKNKQRWWFAVGGAEMKIQNIRVLGLRP